MDQLHQKMKEKATATHVYVSTHVRTDWLAQHEGYITASRYSTYYYLILIDRIRLSWAVHTRSVQSKM